MVAFFLCFWISFVERIFEIILGPSSTIRLFINAYLENGCLKSELLLDPKFTSTTTRIS